MTSRHIEDWSDDKARRHDRLVDKEIDGTILEDEKTEMSRLRAEMLAHCRRVAPLPLDDLQEIHHEMLRNARADNHSGAIAMLKEWLDEFYFENDEGRYIECRMCGADDSSPCEDDCISKRTKVFLAELRLAEIERLRKTLAEIMNPEFIDEWLDTPTASLDNMKPVEVVERGESNRVWGILYHLRSGMPA